MISCTNRFNPALVLNTNYSKSVVCTTQAPELDLTARKRPVTHLLADEHSAQSGHESQPKHEAEKSPEVPEFVVLRHELQSLIDKLENIVATPIKGAMNQGFK